MRPVDLAIRYASSNKYADDDDDDDNSDDDSDDDDDDDDDSDDDSGVGDITSYLALLKAQLGPRRVRSVQIICGAVNLPFLLKIIASTFPTAQQICQELLVCAGAPATVAPTPTTPKTVILYEAVHPFELASFFESMDVEHFALWGHNCEHNEFSSQANDRMSFDTMSMSPLYSQTPPFNLNKLTHLSLLSVQETEPDSISMIITQAPNLETITLRYPFANEEEIWACIVPAGEGTGEIDENDAIDESELDGLGEFRLVRTGEGHQSGPLGKLRNIIVEGWDGDVELIHAAMAHFGMVLSVP